MSKMNLKEANLRLMIIEALDEAACEMDECGMYEDEELDEFSGAAGGAVAGYTLPLGMRPNGPRAAKNKSKKNKINRIYYRNKLLLHDLHLPSNKKKIWYLQLIPETIIRFLTGRFYFLGSIFDYVTKRKELVKSNKDFEKAAIEYMRMEMKKRTTITLSKINELIKEIQSDMDKSFKFFQTKK